MTQLCVFPIPECVTFPGTVFPLHVFEPRYRKMIQRCLDESIPVAICHTEKLIRPAQETETVGEALCTDQATYRPTSVFSAGQCELHETTDDGRMYLSVHLDQRYQLGEVVQHMPYLMVECEPLLDDTPYKDATTSDLQVLQDKLLHRLEALLAGEPEPAATQLLNEWQQQTPEHFSFSLFGAIQFDAEQQQAILEMRSPKARLECALDLLNAVG